MNRSHNILGHGRTCNYFAGNYIYEKRAARTNYLLGKELPNIWRKDLAGKYFDLANTVMKLA